MNPTDLPAPDPRPGVAVPIYWQGAAKKIPMPKVWPANDRVDVGSRAGFPKLRGEHWPVTAEGLMLYNLWREHGVRALCVPLNP
jgi:hypothetical protein